MRIFILLITILSVNFSFAQSWKPVNGSKDSRNHYTAFTNATIFVKDGELLKKATLLIKNNKIIAVGTLVSIPSNTIVYDLEEKFIYPSFIELNSQYGITPIKRENSRGRPQIDTKKQPVFYWNESIKPEINAADLVKYEKKEAEKLRSMGFGTVLTHQNDGLMRGTSALVSLNDQKDFALIEPEVATHYSFNKGSSKQSYPSSLMGMIALIRQVNFDAEWYSKNRNDENYNRSLSAILETNALPKFFDAGNTLSMLRADKIGDEFGFQFILKGNGTEYKRIADLKNTAAAVVVPINFPSAYQVSDPYDAQRLPLSKMKDWELADENLRFLQEGEVQFAITSKGIKDKKTWQQNLKAAVDQGLRSGLAIKALTEIPATLIKVESKVGTLEKGKYANFIITSDSLFSGEEKIYSNWVLGKEHRLENEALFEFVGNYSLNINKKNQFEIKITEKGKGYSAKVAVKNTNEFKPAKFSTTTNRINLIFTIDTTLYRLTGSTSDKLSRIWSGKTIINGKWVDWAAIKKESDVVIDTTNLDSLNLDTTLRRSRVNFPNMAFGWDSIPTKAQAIVFRNATIWTNEEEGIIRNSDVVIADGKIKMVGYKINLDVMFPKMLGQFKEIDATGLHLTSGIIDEHSHIAISRGVNESGQAITSEVSISDVVNSDDINIYRQLSGGVTASQLLHGSANPIGGQSAIIKLRWGQSPEKMKINGADGFIKFALGENVKQSNWGDFNTVRFPQTRMGVEQVFYDGFTRAKEYNDTWKIYNAKSKKEKKKTNGPRIDLELEALGQILDTSRFISCHSYIQSEINMLLHVGDSMGFRVNTFTHILEGYKVADKMVEHGAAGSTFSDWWAYKYEVNDAIPYNGAIMHKQGVLTGFNSDDAEMARRLNQEAAKAIKYGGVSEEEAWKFVTLNPAKMLHLEDRMGSVKAGKDADIVLWTDHPMSIYAKVKTTYIDGIPYFDAARDLELRKKVVLEREQLIARMLSDKKAGNPTQVVKKEKKVLYECDTIEE